MKKTESSEFEIRDEYEKKGVSGQGVASFVLPHLGQEVLAVLEGSLSREKSFVAVVVALVGSSTDVSGFVLVFLVQPLSFSLSCTFTPRYYNNKKQPKKP